MNQQPDTDNLVLLEAEQALLGAMMIDNKIIDDVLDKCQASDFAEPLHGRIFAATVGLHSQGKNANPITLAPMLANDPALKDMGGPAYLARLSMNMMGLMGAKDMAAQIAEFARMRKIRASLGDVMARLNEGSTTAAEAAAELEAAAWMANEAQSSQKSMSFADLLGKVIDRQAKMDAGEAMPGMKCHTIGDFDAITGGLQDGWLLVLAGRPGMGKTATASSACLGYAMNGHGTLLISLEMGDIDIGMRVASDACHLMKENVPLSLIRDGKIRDNHRAALAKAQEWMRTLPLRLVDSPAMTLARIGSTIRREKRRFAAQNRVLKVVMIDYLQLILPDKSSGNRVQDVSEISRGLKLLAKQEDVCIIALAQLNRAVEQREDKRPMLADLRDSGQIEQDADVIIFLYREEYYLEKSKPDSDEQKLLKWEQAMAAIRGRIAFIGAKVRQGHSQTLLGHFHGANQAVRGSDFMRREMAGED